MTPHVPENASWSLPGYLYHSISSFVKIVIGEFWLGNIEWSNLEAVTCQRRQACDFLWTWLGGNWKVLIIESVEKDTLALEIINCSSRH